MLLSRNAFFLLLTTLALSPFLIAKLYWLSNTTETDGVVWFVGKTMELDGGISSHLVIRFKSLKDSVAFNAPTSLKLAEGDKVAVIYNKDNPNDARVNTFIRVWGDTIVYGLWPVLVILVVYLIPASLDPIVPKRSRILINRKNLIRIIGDDVRPRLS